ncbi:MAG: HEAT repeat domain-containing protein, partial [Planctomycetota bacterium]
MERVTAGSCALVLVALLAGCASEPEKKEKTWEELRAERVAEFMLHLNNRSETERHRNGLIEVGLRSPEDRSYVIRECGAAYDRSIERGGTGTGVLRADGRRRVMEVLARLPQDPVGGPLLQKGLKDVPQVRIPAAAALVEQGQDSALPALVQATIETVDEAHKREGAQHLRKLAIPRRRETFLNALDQKGMDLLRPVLPHTFPQDPQERGAALRQVASSHQNPYARAFALAALAEAKDPAAVELARKALDAGDEVVRPTALEVLGTAGGNKAAGELEKVLRTNPQDVDAVVVGLYEVGSAEALERALTLVRDDALTGRTRAGIVRGFLGRLREPQAPEAYRRTEAREAAVAALRERLEDQDRGVVVAAAEAIGKIGEPGADVEPLLGLLRDPTPEVGKAVVRALGRLGGMDAGAKLVQLLEGDATLRETAAEAFAALPRAKDVPVGAVIDMLLDERADVRRAAIVALKHLRKDKDPMGYDADGSESSRKLAVERWRAWW